MNINSPKYEGLKMLNSKEDIMTSFGNEIIQSETSPLSPRKSDRSYQNNYEYKEEESYPKYTNYYIQQLMNKMIANKNRKHKNKIDTLSDVENNRTNAFHRIDTDTTFPSIPMNDFNKQFSINTNTNDIHSHNDINDENGTNTMNTCSDIISPMNDNDNTAPIPDSLPSDIDIRQQSVTDIEVKLPPIHKILNRHKHMNGTSMSSTGIDDTFRKSSYLTMCVTCGTSHPTNYDNDGNKISCTVFTKFNIH
eukprot:125510_1